MTTVKITWTDKTFSKVNFGGFENKQAEENATREWIAKNILRETNKMVKKIDIFDPFKMK